MAQIHDLMAVGQTHRSDQTQRTKDQPRPEPVLAAAGLLPGDGFAEKALATCATTTITSNFNSMALLVSITTASQLAL